jgi:hypothetical protein
MSRRLNGIALFSILVTNLAFAAPAQVIILRHAEKPKHGNDLDTRGYERANALPGLFTTDPVLIRYGKPAAIYAMGPNSDDLSNRPVETVTPLAQSLHLSLQDNFTLNELTPLVNAVMTNPDYDDKTVVICWEHKVIPTLVQAFGYNDAPSKWKKNTFDRLWILHFTGNTVSSFENLPQDLLPGDSTN